MVVSLLLAACFETLSARGIPASAGGLGTLILQPEPGADSVRVWRDVLFEVDVKAGQAEEPGFSAGRFFPEKAFRLCHAF